MIFAASATFIEETLKVPALIIFLYKLSTLFAAILFDPLVNLTIFSNLFFLSPGLILLENSQNKNLC